MKKTIISAILIFILLTLTAVIAMPNTAQAGLWEKVSSLGLPTKKATAEYTVSASGWDIRVYEWVPASNPNIHCVFAAGSKKGGVACY